MSPTRRTLLKTAALPFAGGALAGCLGGSASTRAAAPEETSGAPTTETKTTRGDGGSERASASDFESWLPDPRRTPLRDGYGVQYFDAAAIRERRGDIHESAYERLETEMLNAGPTGEYVDEDAVTATLGIGFGISVALGSFDPDEFGERYARERARRETASTATTHTSETATTHTSETATPEQYAGFDIYGTDRAYAVSEDAIIEVDYVFEGDPHEYARAVVDAQSDGATAYTDSNEYASAMLGLVDESHALKCYPEAMDGSTSRGFRKDVMTGGLKAWRFGGETTHLTLANTYPDPESARKADLGAYVESESARFGAYDGLEVETEGRMVWTEGTVPTGEFDYLSSGGPGDGVHTPNG